MMTKSMVESTWAEDMGQFFYHLDSDTRKITSNLEKIKLKIINSVPSSLTKLALIYINIFFISFSLFISVCMCVRERERERERTMNHC